MLITLCAIFIMGLGNTYAQDWSQNATLPGTPKCEILGGRKVCLTDQNRSNIYQQTPDELQLSIEEGSRHALQYPVKETGLKVPFRPLKNFFESKSNSWIRRIFYKITKLVSPFKSLHDVFSWVGLHDYPIALDEYGPNVIADMGELQDYAMGVTIDTYDHSKYLSFSCATCHSANLFGTKILGMSNRFPKANEVFVIGQKALTLLPTKIFKTMAQATAEEAHLYDEARRNIQHVGLKMPLTLGLDTSLAQVGLSLAKRTPDDYATKSDYWSRHPRKSPLDNIPADSKPAVWWNLKYKTRWLSDGSVISGNPIYTNFLWNEIGRGVDLKELEQWLMDNQKVIKDLTAYVFAAKSPQYNDFFPGEIDINKAKRGQQLFVNNCSGCHGKYDKGWDESNANSYEEQIATTKTWYHKKTRVVNIGTDPLRAKGMSYFAEDLNRLKISKTIGTVVQPQLGYVPPPLEGIWARWPYFHNNSVPTLYDVLTPEYDRPVDYIATPAEDPNVDFDKVKNGYPAKHLVRDEYRNNNQYYFNTRVRGLSNRGHTTGVLLDNNGKEKFDHNDKLAVIEFLKTL